MTIPNKVFHVYYERGKYIYYRNEKEYRKCKYFVLKLPKWFVKANSKALKESYEDGRWSIKSEINKILS